MEFLVTRRARSVRKCYYNQVKRPYKTEDYVDNWRLLNEGLDIIWPGIVDDIKHAIRSGEWYRVRILLKADLRGMKISIPYHIDRDIIDLIIKSGLRIIVIGSTGEVDIQSIRELLTLGLEIKLDLSSHEDNVSEIEGLIKLGVRVRWKYVDRTIPRKIIDRFRDVGVEVTLRPLRSENYHQIDEVANIIDNLEEPLILDIKRSRVLSEYLELIRHPFIVEDKISYIMSSYRIFFREFENLSLEEKDNLFRGSCIGNQFKYIRHMFNNGYQPDLSQIQTISPRVFILLLDSPNFSEEDKYEFFKRLALSLQSVESKLHPSTHKYWVKLKGENYRDEHCEDIKRTYRMVYEMDYHLLTYNIDKIREYLQSGGRYSVDYMNGDYTVLSLCYDDLSDEQRCYYFSRVIRHKASINDLTNPIFKDLWSIVPNDNLEFLWFLYYNGIKLPPSNCETDIIPRLLQEEDPLEVIKRLISRDDDLLLLQFLNESKIKVRTLMGLSPKIDLLIERFPIRNMKAAIKS